MTADRHQQDDKEHAPAVEIVCSGAIGDMAMLLEQVQQIPDNGLQNTHRQWFLSTRASQCMWILVAQCVAYGKQKQMRRLNSGKTGVTSALRCMPLTSSPLMTQ